MRVAPKVLSGGNWHQINPPWVVSGGAWHQCSQVWVVNGGNWHPVFDFVNLPVYSEGWVNTNGRGGSIPGVIWGSTGGYNYWNLKTIKTVVGIQIEISLNKSEGSYHGKGGQFAARSNGGDTQWTAQPWDGQQTSPVIPCNFAAGEQIRVWCYGNGDRGDGKLFNWIRIVNIIYG